MSYRALLAALAVAGGLASSGANAQVVQAGNLTCDVEGGVGLVLGSRKEVVCTFQNAAGDTEVYDGAIRKLGVDIGMTGQSVIVWSVLAPSGRTTRGALAGSYVGGTAEATVGGGIGANALIGGFGRSITLQPVSLTAQQGLNVAAGAAELTLRLRPEPTRGRR